MQLIIRDLIYRSPLNNLNENYDDPESHPNIPLNHYSIIFRESKLAIVPV